MTVLSVTGLLVCWDYWLFICCFLFCSSTLRSRSRSGLYISDDYNNVSGMSRSRSMTRLPMTSSQDLGDPSLNQSLQSLRVRPFEHSLRHLKDNLDDSENRRIVLVHKLKEAQETLEVWRLQVLYDMLVMYVEIL